MMHKSTNSLPKSPILNEETLVPITVEEPRVDPLIVNEEETVISGETSNARKRKSSDDDGQKRKKKMSKGRKHSQLKSDHGPPRRYGKGKVHHPEEDVVPQSFDFEEELVVDRSQRRTARGDHERNALEGAQTPPRVIEVDKNRY